MLSKILHFKFVCRFTGTPWSFFSWRKSNKLDSTSSNFNELKKVMFWKILHQTKTIFHLLLATCRIYLQKIIYFARNISLNYLDHGTNSRCIPYFCKKSKLLLYFFGVRRLFLISTFADFQLDFY